MSEARTESRGWYPDRTGARYVHVPLGKGKRKSVRLASTTDEQATARAAMVREIARVLHTAGQHTEAVEWATKAAEGDDERAAKILGYARALAKGDERKTKAASGEIKTFKDIGDAWTSGELARKHPDHIATKRTVDMDASRLEWLYEKGGLANVPITAFTVEHADRAMAKLEPGLRPSTRRHYAQTMRRVLQMAVYPLRLIAANPIPRGFLPRIKQDVALQMPYPEEERALLGCKLVPLPFRMLYGFLSRMGFRKSEAIGGEADDEEPTPPLKWGQIDVVRGVVYMARSKTDKPRPVVLAPDVVAALKRWRELRPAKDSDAVFRDDAGAVVGLVQSAIMFRQHLTMAGVTRAELHDTKAKDSVAVRVHDLRALFVTVSLAQGKGEFWIRDRTAHRTLSMLDRYRRHARMFEELHLGALAPMHEAIPELVVERDDDPSKLSDVSDEVSDSGRTGHDRSGTDVAIPAETAPIASEAVPIAPVLDPLIKVRILAPEQRLTETDPSRPTPRPTRERRTDVDPVEAALAAGVNAIAASMANASPGDLVALADRMATLARELEARRGARAYNVVELDSRARRRSRQ